MVVTVYPVLWIGCGLCFPCIHLPVDEDIGNFKLSGGLQIGKFMVGVHGFQKLFAGGAVRVAEDEKEHVGLD